MKICNPGSKIFNYFLFAHLFAQRLVGQIINCMLKSADLLQNLLPILIHTNVAREQKRKLIKKLIQKRRKRISSLYSTLLKWKAKFTTIDSLIIYSLKRARLGEKFNLPVIANYASPRGRKESLRFERHRECPSNKYT